MQVAHSGRQPASKGRGSLVRSGSILAVAVLVLTAAAGTVMAQGVALRSVGPINQSVAGVATAMPIDSVGAIHWNPATISGLPASDVSFGFDLILPSTELSSSAFGTEGTTEGEPGVSPVPSMAFVRKSPDSPWSCGLGVFGIGGFRANYPASLTNPILMPQPLGLGRVSAEVDILQIVPTVSYELTERLSIGVAPTITMAKLVASPLFLGPADQFIYSDGVGTRYIWGGGVQAGLYYVTESRWHFGAAVASPQWMEPFRYHSTGVLGDPRLVEFHMDYPLVASLGAAYSGFDRWVIGCDVRYFDYANTAGFGGGGFGADGSLAGLDWNNVIAVAVGVQRQVGERLFLRGGYCFNENPIGSGASSFNVASPLVIQHTVHVGLSWGFADNWLFSVAYAHAFENSVTGPITHPILGVLPDSSVTSTASAHALSIGVSKRF